MQAPAPPPVDPVTVSALATPPLRRALAYAKFAGPGPFKFCVLTTGYHLQHECIMALRSLGHTAIEVPLSGLSWPQALRTTITHLLGHKPDGLLTINHLGFDDGHQLGDFLEACEIPVACWYCDSPFFVLRHGGVPAKQVTSLFVWERAYAATLKAHGATDVSHLPLGCDARRLDAQNQDAPWAPAAYPMSFVGNSMRDACAQWRQGLGPQEQLWHDRWLDALTTAPRHPLAKAVHALQIQHPALKLWDALGAATFEATLRYRDGLLAQLPPADLHVFGDAGWKGALPSATRLHPPVPYGPTLGKIYGASAININATSLQMPTSVNQRVFDVPMAAGFLLSDAQDDMQALFEIGQEAIVYGSPEELAHLANYYSQRPKARRAIVQQAQRRIEACHTYAHRMGDVVNALKLRSA